MSGIGNAQNGRFENFSKDLCWDEIFSRWSYTMDTYGSLHEPLFVELLIHDPARPDRRETSLNWVERKNVKPRHRRVQQHFERYPGTKGPIGQQAAERKGPQRVLDYLWQYRANNEAVAAILFGATMFEMLGRRGAGSYPRDDWPRRSAAEMVRKRAGEVVGVNDTDALWDWQFTQLFPIQENYEEISFSDFSSFLIYVAERHALLLAAYQPVAFTFVDDLPDENTQGSK